MDYEAKARAAAKHFTSGQGITWREFESFMGLKIRPAVEGTLEWKGYIQKRNEIRSTLNGFGMELPKREAFQIRPPQKNSKGEYEVDTPLQFLRGADLVDNLFRQKSTRMVNAPRNMAQIMEDVVSNFQLPAKTRNKALNYATLGKMLHGVVSDAAKNALNDPEMALPDYSREELMRLTIKSAGEALDDEEAG